MQSNSADAVKRVLTMAGVTGAALTLATAAALPAFADHDGDSSDQSKGASHSQDAGDQGQHNGADQGKSDEHENAGGGQNSSGDDGHNPPGNNGTVKIHQTAGDSSPHNVPHVDCSFYVSFFGFDANQLLNISFTGQAPTGKDVPIAIKDPTKTSKTSTTDAGGAGNDYDGDQGVYDGTNLDLSGLGAPAKQGFHIKLDVSTGEPGGHKYKVFWFTPCTSGSTTQGATTDNGGTTQNGTTTQGGTTTQAGTTTQGSTVQGTTAQSGTTTSAGEAAATTTGNSSGAASVLGESLSRGTPATNTGSSSGGAQVLGEKVSRSTPGLASLPFTGSEAGVLSALGLAALSGGAALTVAGRRRRAAARS